MNLVVSGGSTTKRVETEYIHCRLTIKSREFYPKTISSCCYPYSRQVFTRLVWRLIDSHNNAISNKLPGSTHPTIHGSNSASHSLPRTPVAAIHVSYKYTINCTYSTTDCFR